MRTAAEAVYGKSLVWFFDQWVRGTGLLDYAFGGARTATQNGRLRDDRARRAARRAEAPMPVGVLTSSGWTIVHADPMLDVQDVRITTTERPQRVELDPNHVTWDWDRRNNAESSFLITVRAATHRVQLAIPRSGRSCANTIVARGAGALVQRSAGSGHRRTREDELSVDRRHSRRRDRLFGAAIRAISTGTGRVSRHNLNVWARAENLYLPGAERPLMGYGGAFNFLDGLLKARPIQEL